MIMAIPTIRHNIAIAFLCDFFFIESFVKIGITNHITNPIIMDIMFYYCPLNFKDSKNVWLER